MIFLASQSPRRRELMRRLGVPFRVVSSRGRERVWPHLKPSINAMRNAAIKALGARVRARKGLVIGADTFIYFQGRIIGKPKNLRDAERTLKALSGKKHYVYTGVAIHNLETKRLHILYARTKLVFRKLSGKQIKEYVEKWRPLDKAGAYAIQEDGHLLIRRIVGSRSNVIGFPLELFRRELRRAAGERA